MLSSGYLYPALDKLQEQKVCLFVCQGICVMRIAADHWCSEFVTIMKIEGSACK